MFAIFLPVSLLILQILVFRGQHMGHLGLAPLRARRGSVGRDLQLLKLQLRDR